jgi:NADPH:quinone reductase-like Zn-dependent oxidoreductase
MKAIVRDRYGLPDVLELREIDIPVAKDDEVLVRVRAASLNQADLDYLYGSPCSPRWARGSAGRRTVVWAWTWPGGSRRSART